MLPKKESPALAARGVPVTDQADGSITPESNELIAHLQVVRLTRRCAVSAAMAAVLAPLVYGEGRV